MKARIPFMAGLLLLSTCIFGQTARVQIIHNSPTATVDLYANGTKIFDNFAFRTATPYMDLPAGVSINLGVGLASSQSVRDTLVNFPIVLQSGKRYVIGTNGTLGSIQKPFNIAINDMGMDTASTPTHVGVGFFHGSQNAPEVDFLSDSSIIFDNIGYAKFGKYIQIPSNSTLPLYLTPSTENNNILAKYDLNLSFWAGKTAVIFTTGFIGSTNPNELFETWVALSNGGTFPLKSLPVSGPRLNTRLQFIHDSPIDTIDIYLNGEKFIDNFAFRTATPYMSVQGGITLNFGIAHSTSTSVRDVIVNFPIRLDSGKTYIAMTHGILGTTQKPFGIAVTDPFAAREISSNPNNVDINFFNGALDITSIDVLIGTNVVSDSVRYARFGDNISIPANATYRLNMTSGDNNNIVIGQYDLNLSTWKGKSAFIIATGFVSGGSVPFQPWVVLSSGATYPLAPVSGPKQTDSFSPLDRKTTANFETYPNPANEFVVFDFMLENEANVHFQITNMNGQIVADRRLGKLSKGSQQLTLDTKTFNTGMYIIRMSTDNDVQTKKLVIKR